MFIFIYCFSPLVLGLGKTFFGLTYVDVMISEERPGPITSYVLEVSYSMVPTKYCSLFSLSDNFFFFFCQNLADQASIATTEAGFDFVLENCHINSLFPFHFVVDNSNTIVFGGSFPRPPLFFFFFFFFSQPLSSLHQALRSKNAFHLM